MVDHLEAETGGRWWSREEIVSILKVLSGEVKAEEENSDLPFPQVSQPLLFTNLKCYSLDFPWETLRFLDPPLSWRFPLVKDHQCSHLTSRLRKDLSEEGEMFEGSQWSEGDSCISGKADFCSTHHTM